jgi:hypothetical protein
MQHDRVQHAEPGHDGKQQDQRADQAGQGQEERVVSVDAHRVAEPERAAQSPRVRRRRGAGRSPMS